MIIYQVIILFLFFKYTDTEKYWKYQYLSTFLKQDISVSVFGNQNTKYDYHYTDTKISILILSKYTGQCSGLKYNFF